MQRRKGIYGTFMFDIHADGTVSLILCYHNVLELNFFFKNRVHAVTQIKDGGTKTLQLSR